MVWLGEQAPTQFLDANLNAFEEGNGTSIGMSLDGSNESQGSVTSILSDSRNHGGDAGGGHRSILPPFTSSPSYNTIRFQIIVWSIGSPDVKSGRVSMKFRVTMFWNVTIGDPKTPASSADHNNLNVNSANLVPNGPGASANLEKLPKPKGPTVWVMSGRGRAYEKNLRDTLPSSSNDPPAQNSIVDVPPVSILNSDSFEIIGQPEIMLLQESKQKGRLMRWSCMYRAQLHQEDMTVKDFPHDSHRLCIKIGILSQRQPGGIWDRNKWKLALANESDTQRTIKVPHGLIVDNVRIPGFHYNKEKGMEFDFIPLSHGGESGGVRDRSRSRRSRRGKEKNGSTSEFSEFISTSSTNLHHDRHHHRKQYHRKQSQIIPNDSTDHILRTSVQVSRDSGYYDKNIMPLLYMLNIVAISILSLDATFFFQRGLLALNIAFVEIGLRMTLDSKLPHVGYNIKMQKVLNWFFFSILLQMLESAMLKFVYDNEYCSLGMTRKVDIVVVLLLLANQFYLTLYYNAKKDDRYECYEY